MRDEEKIYGTALAQALSPESTPPPEVELVPESSGRRPDLNIPTLGMLVEIKRIIDEPETQRSARWSSSSDGIRQAIHRHPGFNQVRGYYLLSSDDYPVVRRNRHEQVADDIVQAILRGEEQVVVPGGGPSFRIRRVESDSAGVDFSTSSFGWGNSKKGISEAIAPLLKHANDQLSWQPPSEVTKRIVLLVNFFRGSRWTADVVSALALIYPELLSYGNIDEIWLLNVTDEGFEKAEFVYGRAEARAHEAGWTSISERGREWLAKWFYDLNECDKSQRKKLIAGVEACSRNMAPHVAFPDALERSQIVRACEWPLETDQPHLAVKLIEKFVDDPDPSGPDLGQDSLHLQVAEGKEPSTITTVLGHLAWAVQKIALRRDLFDTALHLTERLLAHQNLYVKQQACVPLVELASRARYFLQNGEETRAQAFKSLLLTKVEECGRYTAIADKLVHAAMLFREFDEAESHLLLDRLGHHEDTGALYFLLSMPMDPSGNIREVTSLRLRMEKLLDGDSLPVVRGRLVWWLCRQLQDCDLEREFPRYSRIMVPLIDRIWATPHEPKVHGSVSCFFDTLFDRAPEVVLEWNLKAWSLFREHLRDHPPSAATFVHISSTSKLLGAAAKRGIWLYRRYVTELYELWKANAFIGKPDELFRSVEMLPEDHRAEGLALVCSTYQHMIAIHPTMPRSNWLDSLSVPIGERANDSMP